MCTTITVTQVGRGGKCEGDKAKRAEYIIGFNSYKPAVEWEVMLHGVVPVLPVVVIPRNNSAAAYPTDFLLLSIDSHERDGPLVALRSIPAVKYVTENIQLSRRQTLATHPPMSFLEDEVMLCYST
jgi:hypothetical protein